jgi:two-component system, chemotaxis family, response regulator PixH
MKTILAIEDSRSDMLFLESCLIDAGYHIIGVADYSTAKEYLKTANPDLIIVDIMLPDCSGFEICRAFKLDNKRSKTPVVICSSKQTEVDRLWGQMLGVDGYVGKPVQVQEILSLLHSLLA